MESKTINISFYNLLKMDGSLTGIYHATSTNNKLYGCTRFKQKKRNQQY